MQNKKMFMIMGVVVVVVGAAAFVAGRLLNGKGLPMGLALPFGKGNGPVMTSIQLEPAEEVPTTQPAVIGQFAERQDNIVIVSSLSMKAGGGGVVVSVSKKDGDEDGGEEVAGSPMNTDGPKVEVVITNETIIYKDTTEPPAPSGGNQTIQQTVGEGTLDDLTSDSFISVWGRKSGDRIIADVLLYSQPVVFKRPG